ncbi:hypothetical protein BV20DRAFT_971322 [Pilatotrama ljubarskyi]|nr:hypothetical protein BV20DRAFT_971322 [Pilatotrama ljubarskyi]
MAQSGYSSYYQQPAYPYPAQFAPPQPTQPHHDPRVQAQYTAQYQPSNYPQPAQAPPYAYPIQAAQRPPSRIAHSPLPPSPVTAPQQYGQFVRPSPSPQPYHAPAHSNPYPSPVSPQTPHTPQAATPQSARRPLPDPRGFPPAPQSAGYPVAPPRPPPSPQPAYATHRPTQSVPSVFPSHPQPSHNPYPSAGQDSPPTSSTFSATSTSPPRPLPLPRSPGNFDLSSAQQAQQQPRPQSPPKRALPEPQPSPTRDSNIRSPEPISASGQRFVPLWKRALPQPGASSSRVLPSPTESRQQVPTERRSTVSTGASRPLPLSPSGGSSPTVGTPRDPFARAGTLPPHLQLPHLPPTPQSPEKPSTNGPPQAAPPPAGVSNSSASPPSSRFAIRERSRTLPLPSAAPTYPLPPKPSEPPSPSSPRKFTSQPISESPQSSDDEELTNALLERQPRSPSPQYGIRDLPRNDQPHSEPSGRPNNVHAEATQATPRARRELPSPVPAAQTQSSSRSQGGDTGSSLAFRMAAVSLQSNSPAPAPPFRPSHGHSNSLSSRPMPQPPSNAQPEQDRQPQPPQPQRGQWPSALPPLPRAPASPQPGTQSALAQVQSQQSHSRPLPSRSNTGTGNVPPFARPRSPRKAADLDLSLDDAPPPSLRKSPAPASSRSPVSFASRLSGRSGSTSAGSGAHLERTPSQDTASVFSLSSFPQPPTHVEVKPQSPTKFAFRPPSPAKPTPGSTSPQYSPTKTQFAVRAPSPTKYNPPAFVSPERNQPSPRIPKISFPANPDGDSDEDDRESGPVINISGPSASSGGGASGLPRISVGDDNNDNGIPSISVGGADDGPPIPQISLPGDPSSSTRERRDRPQTRKIQETLSNPRLEAAKRSGLVCGGCGGPIIGRIVSAMDMRWHPGCFRCCVCDELLENLSSYAHEGRPYCHLDYHEKFAPRCYHCQTAIVDERFITLDDPELGKRTYHEQHFFCAECGDPFLPPSSPGAPSRTFAGDGEFAVGTEDDVGFTVYRGHPYCEACHVRLRLPKCKKCKKSIRDGMQAVEALGGKWCWECFTCASCNKPFEDPAFFQRDNKPFCERCFSIMIRNEI